MQYRGKSMQWLVTSSSELKYYLSWSPNITHLRLIRANWGVKVIWCKCILKCWPLQNYHIERKISGPHFHESEKGLLWKRLEGFWCWRVLQVEKPFPLRLWFLARLQVGFIFKVFRWVSFQMSSQGNCRNKMKNHIGCICPTILLKMSFSNIY